MIRVFGAMSGMWELLHSSRVFYRVQILPVYRLRLKLQTPSQIMAISKSHCKKEESLQVRFVGPLAAALLLLVGLRGEVDSAAHRWVRARLAGVQSLAGNDAVDFWGRGFELVVAWTGVPCVDLELGLTLPVRMFWKASSTLLASRAEVSMKERLFSPVASRQPQSPSPRLPWRN